MERSGGNERRQPQEGRGAQKGFLSHSSDKHSERTSPRILYRLPSYTRTQSDGPSPT